MITLDTELNPLISQLFASMSASGSRAVAFVSSTRHEGTTTIVQNVMRRVASDSMGRRKICAIDANYDNPELNRAFNLPARPGLEDYILGAARIDEILHQTDISPDARLIPFTANVSSAASLQISGALPILVGELKKRFDLILIDSAPIAIDNNIQICCPQIDDFYLVVKAHDTQREIAQKAVDRLRANGCPVRGVILNQRQFIIPRVFY